MIRELNENKKPETIEVQTFICSEKTDAQTLQKCQTDVYRILQKYSILKNPTQVK